MKYITQHNHGLSKNQKWVIASTSSGFALENMDVLFFIVCNEFNDCGFAPLWWSRGVDLLNH